MSNGQFSDATMYSVKEGFQLISLGGVLVNFLLLKVKREMWSKSDGTATNKTDLFFLCIVIVPFSPRFIPPFGLSGVAVCSSADSSSESDELELELELLSEELSDATPVSFIRLTLSAILANSGSWILGQRRGKVSEMVIGKGVSRDYYLPLALCTTCGRALADREPSCAKLWESLYASKSFEWQLLLCPSWERHATTLQEQKQSHQAPGVFPTA